jgi:hypothetical protein
LSKQDEQYFLKPSDNIRKNFYLANRWIQDTHKFERFLNLTLSLIHPELFEMGLHMLRKLRKEDYTRDISREWQSVYTGISAIVNRITPGHRDSKGRPEWFDLLVNYNNKGKGSNPRLFIEDVGLDLNYSSGTVIALCGSVLKHEVRQWGGGDRICMAHFMREAVRKRLNVHAAGWVEQSTYYQYFD